MSREHYYLKVINFGSYYCHYDYFCKILFYCSMLIVMKPKGNQILDLTNTLLYYKKFDCTELDQKVGNRQECLTKNAQ